MIGRATASARNQYLEQIKSALQKIDNHKFEDMIGELFIKNGYTLTDNNWYDGEGGDVDLVFECFNRNTLMYNIYEICDVKMPHIYVQAKKKTGKDAGDIVKAGDPIATVGTSGGHNHPALYFAIRQQGRASDPARWCRAQG